MNFDSGEDGEERLLGSIAYSHLMEMIVVQDSVVYSFCRCPVVVNLLPFIRSVRNFTEEADVIAVIVVYGSSVRGGTTFVFEWT